MKQSEQDDIFEAFETFWETTLMFLRLVARQRKLNQDEVYLLERAAKVGDRLAA